MYEHSNALLEKLSLRIFMCELIVIVPGISSLLRTINWIQVYLLVVYIDSWLLDVYCVYY